MWNFYQFPHTVVFQQENEIPVSVQQDSCSNHVIIFISDMCVCYLFLPQISFKDQLQD